MARQTYYEIQKVIYFALLKDNTIKLFIIVRKLGLTLNINIQDYPKQTWIIYYHSFSHVELNHKQI